MSLKTFVETVLHGFAVSMYFACKVVMCDGSMTVMLYVSRALWSLTLVTSTSRYMYKCVMLWCVHKCVCMSACVRARCTYAAQQLWKNVFQSCCASSWKRWNQLYCHWRLVNVSSNGLWACAHGACCNCVSGCFLDICFDCFLFFDCFLQMLLFAVRKYGVSIVVVVSLAIAVESFVLISQQLFFKPVTPVASRSWTCTSLSCFVLCKLCFCVLKCVCVI